MIDKEIFVDLMRRWTQLNSDLDEALGVMRKLFDVGLGESWLRFDELLCDAIASAVDDKGEWVSYFAFERGFNLDEPCVYDSDDKPVPTRTWEDVYDLIVDTNRDLGAKSDA